MVFHLPQKQVNILNIEIENIEIEFADEFNFLGLTIHKHLKCDLHINKKASKILNIIGIMYRLKHMVPSKILLPIYNGLIKPHILYGLKSWGFNQEKKIQKESMRIICSSGYLSHSELLFKKLNVLKIDGMFNVTILLLAVFLSLHIPRDVSSFSETIYYFIEGWPAWKRLVVSLLQVSFAFFYNHLHVCFKHK